MDILILMTVMDYREHYRSHLSGFYSWMFGDFDSAVAAQRRFFEARSIAPGPSGVAVDLGSGSGFQSIALAELGFDVLAVDTSDELLRELKSRNESVRVQTGDIRHLSFMHGVKPALVVCMGDTITHLASVDEVRSVICQVHEMLGPRGKMILTFRDLTVPRLGVDRFILVRSDPDRILTCFLEDLGDSVEVSDLLHQKSGTEWKLTKSCYRKLKLTLAVASSLAVDAGFSVETEVLKNGMIAVIGKKDCG